ncbi:uncharacterized protein A4U43_C03F15480 [Asparagus officinalis]|uniref:Glutathione S-transferase 3, mitochondrial n=1 Tax=Asparagus officinalis TaxID=4686 RepID=A0A5P1FA96_ASPOF|nr:uncharacterized protein A4U43_C03F15480 [Asparagus officinalis]
MVAIEVPKEYGYVIFVLIFYAFFDFWMGSQVLKARRKYKVFHPTVHAIESENKDAKLFNCVQRGHQNSQEMMPIFFALLLVGGLQYPTMCAGFGLDYIMGRFFYFKGYSTGAPENRFKICGLKIVTTMVFASLILGDGDVAIKLNVKARAFSSAAKENLEAAGCTLTILPGRKKWVKPSVAKNVARADEYFAKKRATADAGSSSA